MITSVYGEEPNGWRTLEPKGKARGKPWFEIAKNYNFFFKFLLKVSNGSKARLWNDN